VHHVDGSVDLHGVESLARLEKEDELLEQRGHLLGAIPLDGDLVAPHADADIVEGLLHQTQQLVPLAQEAGHEMVAGDEDLDLSACHVCSGSTLPARPER
jgi:hypothetical protein